MEQEPPTPRKLTVLAASALLLGVLLGGFPDYTLTPSSGPRTERVVAVHPAPQPENGCFEHGIKLAAELKTPSDAASRKPMHFFCDRAPESFFSASVESFNIVLQKARGEGGAPCAKVSTVQRSCVQRYIDFVDSQLQFCTEMAAQVEHIGISDGSDPVQLVARSDALRNGYCRCLAGALHASVSWIGAPMPEPAPAKYPYPFGEGCGFVEQQEEPAA